MNNSGSSFNIEEFSKKSEEFYNDIKAALERDSKGKYVALDFETRKHWIGDTATDALTAAKQEAPDKLFYLLQIGVPTPYTIQSIKVRLYPHIKHDFARAH